MRFIFIFFFFIYAIKSFSQIDYVKYFDGKKTEIEFFNKINQDTFEINNKKVLASDIEIISYKGELKANVFNIDHKKIRNTTNGINYNSFFAKNSIRGEINLFEYTIKTINSRFSNKYNYRLFYNNGDDGEIKLATFKNLDALLYINSKSYKYLKKSKRKKRTGHIYRYFGLGVFLTGVAVIANEAFNGNKQDVWREEKVKISAVLIGGGILLIYTAKLFPKQSKKNIEKAITAYNNKQF